MHNVMDPPVYNTEYFSCPKSPLCFHLLIHPSFFQLPTLVTTDLSIVCIVLSFPEGQIVGIKAVCSLFKLVSFTWNMHLRFLSVFS